MIVEQRAEDVEAINNHLRRLEERFPGTLEGEGIASDLGALKEEVRFLGNKTLPEVIERQARDRQDASEKLAQTRLDLRLLDDRWRVVRRQHHLRELVQLLELLDTL